MEAIILVQCPSCKSLFDLPESSFAASKFRCSECKYVWNNQHKITLPNEKYTGKTLDWILLWSVLGVIAVVLYVDYPRVRDFFSDLNDRLYGQSMDSVVLNKIAEIEDSFLQGLLVKSGESQPFDLTQDDKGNGSKDNNS